MEGYTMAQAATLDAAQLQRQTQWAFDTGIQRSECAGANGDCRAQPDCDNTTIHRPATKCC